MIPKNLSNFFVSLFELFLHVSSSLARDKLYK